MGVTTKILKRAALTLPPVKQVYRDYHSLVQENEQLTAMVAAVSEEKSALEKIADKEQASQQLVTAIEAERDQLAKTNQGLQTTATLLSSENKALLESVDALTAKYDAAVIVESTFAKECTQLRNQVSELEKRGKGLQLLNAELQATKNDAANKADTNHQEIDGIAPLLASSNHLSAQINNLQDELAGLTNSSQDTNAQLAEKIALFSSHLDNLSDTTTTKFDQLANSIQSHVSGIHSLQESNESMYRTALNNLRVEVVRGSSEPTEQSGGSFAQLWLDLTEAALTGSLFEDDNIDPWSSETYDPSLRIAGRDWPKHAFTMIGTARMRNLRSLTERVIADGTVGDFLEAGVWRGGACIYMKAIITAYQQTSRTVFVADSFCGLPEPDPENYPADKNDAHHSFDQLTVTQDEVEGNFRKFGLLDDSVVFLPGWFKDSLPNAPVEKLAILRLDGDMYESTIQTLEAMYHKVTPGGFVIVDDYILAPCARAVTDFRETHSIKAPLQDVDGAAVWWQVEK